MTRFAAALAVLSLLAVPAMACSGSDERYPCPVIPEQPSAGIASSIVADPFSLFQFMKDKKKAKKNARRDGDKPRTNVTRALRDELQTEGETSGVASTGVDEPRNAFAPAIEIVRETDFTSLDEAAAPPRVTIVAAGDLNELDLAAPSRETDGSAPRAEIAMPGVPSPDPELLKRVLVIFASAFAAAAALRTVIA